MDLFEQLIRVTSVLEGSGIEYALCGGLAVAVHGAPRATTDIDLLIKPEAIETTVVLMKTIGFRFQALPMSFPDGMKIQRVTQIQGRESLILDLIHVVSDLEGVFKERVKLSVHGQTLWVVSREGLIAMKTWSSRPQDLADIQRITDLDR